MYATVSGIFCPTYVMRRSHSSQMFCPGGRPPVLSGASGLVTGAVTCRSPDTGAGDTGAGAGAPPTSTHNPISKRRINF